MRPAPFSNGGYYHVYNRGVDKQIVFGRYGMYSRMIRTIHNILKSGSATPRPKKFQSLALKISPPVTIVCYCLMPNHYHFLIRQDEDGGIASFMHKLDTSYTKYFNLNKKRTGRLFEYTYKARQIESEESLIHISRYIHLNPLIAGLTSDLDLYPWSSYLGYSGKKDDPIIDPTPVLSRFLSVEKYDQFVRDQIQYALILNRAKHEDEDTFYF
jgi:putative transposase